MDQSKQFPPPVDSPFGPFVTLELGQLLARYRLKAHNVIRDDYIAITSLDGYSGMFVMHRATDAYTLEQLLMYANRCHVAGCREQKASMQAQFQALIGIEADDGR